MSKNPFTTNNFIDSCAFDPKYEPEDRASLEIFRLSQEGKLSILIAHSTQKEIEHPNTPAWVKSEAQNLIRTMNVPLTADEVKKLREIEEILAGNGKVESIRQDARHVFEAQKYGSPFITTDSRILNRMDKLYAACTVKVLKPSEFLSLVKYFINVENGNKIGSDASGNVSVKPKPQGDTRVDRIPYKGYIIQATPYHLAESGEWKINIDIEHHTGDEVVNRKPFYAADTFKIKEESIQHCIKFGMQIIDGEVNNCSVSDL